MTRRQLSSHFAHTDGFQTNSSRIELEIACPTRVLGEGTAHRSEPQTFGKTPPSDPSDVGSFRFLITDGKRMLTYVRTRVAYLRQASGKRLLHYRVFGSTVRVIRAIFFRKPQQGKPESELTFGNGSANLILRKQRQCPQRVGDYGLLEL